MVEGIDEKSYRRKEGRRHEMKEGEKERNK